MKLFTQLSLSLLLCLCLIFPATSLSAQGADTPITLREAPAGSTAQRHLLQSVYENVKYPAKASEARRGGAYVLSIRVDQTESTWVVMPLSEQPKDREVTNLVIKAPDLTQGSTVSGQMKIAADRALLEETEKMGRFLVDIGFDPATRQGTPVADTLNLVFYYQLE